MAIITVQAFKCNKCGHVWLAKNNMRKRKSYIPSACAKCKDPRWNRQDINK